jgi:hypothetical protein
VNCAVEMASVEIISFRNVRIMLGSSSMATPYVYSALKLLDSSRTISHPLLVCLSRFINLFIVFLQFIIELLSYPIGTPI